MNAKLITRLGVVGIIVAIVGGCAVHPEPLTDAALGDAAQTNIADVVGDQEPISHPIDLYEAMARAVKYNLDYKVEAMQTAVHTQELQYATTASLPGLVADSGYANRNNYEASSSFNLTSRSPNFSASTSQDRERRNADLSFSWNILDFGLSYVRAQQAADKVLIGRELQRKAIHRLLEDVRTAYWRAVAYDRLVKRLNGLAARTDRALVNTKELADDRQTSRITALTYQRELTEIKRAAIELKRDLIVAKSQLAALMNLRPGTAFAIASSNHGRMSRKLPGTVRDMMQTAVRDREELRENIYQQRINEKEVDAAILEMLPGIQLYASPSWDSNSYLLNSNWLGWGAKASWNLMHVFQFPVKRDLIASQQDLLKSRALALTMAVMTQVHVSHVRYIHEQEEVKVSGEYQAVQRHLVEEIRIEAAASRASEQTLLREELNTLVAEAKYDLARAGLESAYANIFASIGWDPYGAYQRESSVNEIAQSLRNGWLKPTDGVQDVAAK